MYDADIKELIEAARSVQGAFELRKAGFTAASVGTALRTKSGAVFTGVSVHLACGIGFCAEHAAIAEMLKNRETRIQAVASVSAKGVIPPCGRCRELMMQLDAKNSDARIALPSDRVLLLGDLIPEYWIEP